MTTKLNQKKQQNWHNADIVAELHKRGWSLRQLSIANGLAPSTLRSALDRPYPKGEKIIATALGLRVEDIWAEREAYRNFKPSLIYRNNNIRTEV